MHNRPKEVYVICVAERKSVVESVGMSAYLGILGRGRLGGGPGQGGYEGCCGPL